MMGRYWGSSIYVPTQQKFYFYGGYEQYVATLYELALLLISL